MGIKRGNKIYKRKINTARTLKNIKAKLFYTKTVRKGQKKDYEFKITSLYYYFPRNEFEKKAVASIPKAIPMC